jgi:3-dehydroquinate synthase
MARVASEKMVTRGDTQTRAPVRYDGKLMTRVNVATPQRSYEVLIEHGLLERAGSGLLELLGRPSRLFVITVAPVRRRWGKKLTASLDRAGFSTTFLEMPQGERYKRLSTLESLAEKLIRFGADRDAVLLAFGGGVIGDVVGFLASVFMRGIDVVQIPTTVQAQLDAAIGGKTGVNLRTGKNLIGTFHQPRAVLIDLATLSSLPEREFRAGMYEAVKAGVIGRPDLFAEFEHLEIKKLRKDLPLLERIIAQSVELKARVVGADEREGDLRRVLNFGHTIGHALEAETKYRHFLHGEAVAWGMIAASDIARETGKLDCATAGRIQDTIMRLGPLPNVHVRTRNILKLLQSDKKTRKGVVHFVLPTDIGRVEVVKDVPEKVIVRAVENLNALSAQRKTRT